MGENVLLQDCLEVRKEFHERINRLVNVSIRMEEIAKKYEDNAKKNDEIVNKILALLYGNGKEGLVVKLNNIFTSLNIHSKLIFLCLGGILTMAFFVVRSLIQ